MNTPAIDVYCFGHQVGAVAGDPGLNCYVFAWTPEWRRRGIELAPLAMPVDGNREGRFAFPDLPAETFRRLPGMLADALPDAFGNALIDRWMEQHGVNARDVTPLDRLAYMGRRGMGALEFRPARGGFRESQEPLAIAALVEAARRALAGDLGGAPSSTRALTSLIRVGSSAGGARAKAVIAWNRSTGDVRSGQFDAAPGFEHWLLKFDGLGADSELGMSQHYGRVEYAYHLMARAAGIVMSECALLEEGGRAHFLTRRFDRDGNARVHAQTLCAMRHLDFRARGTHAYADLFRVVNELNIGQGAVDEVFRRMAFNVMAANCDDHAKNVAFVLRADAGARWDLAPAYDVTHAFNPRGEWTYQHMSSINGKFAGVSQADLLAEASRFGVKKPALILGTVAAALAGWPEHARAAGLPPAEADRIAADFVLR